MNRFLYLAAGILGLSAVCWIGFGYIGANPLALTMTALIGAFYVMGVLELQRFHQATVTMGSALAAIPDHLPHLGAWLDKLHPSLQNPVRLRIEGERVGLPGPAMVPYLVGLLVLLGMLGTFLGMVVTLNGAVIALESTTDLQAVRAALAAPVKGLGLAFGTSVAGVSASAMLGLMSALCRRERLQSAQLLDTKIAGELRVFSLAHQRQEAFKSLQAQARLMPEVVDKLQTMMSRMEEQSQALNERLVAGQDSFHRRTEAAYAGLASSVDKTLQQSLTESARVAGATIQPVVESTMTGIARETSLLHERMAGAVQLQLDGLSSRFGTAVNAVTDVWARSLAEHQRSSEALATDLQKSLEHFGETFERRSASLVAALTGDTQKSLAALTESFERHSASLLVTVDESHGALQSALASQDQQRLATWTQSLESMAESLHREWQRAGARNLDQHEQIRKTMEQTARDINSRAEAHARDTIAEMARLVQAASEAPRAAAEVIGQLRQKLSDSIARDNDLLDERSRIMATLSTLLDTVQHASTEQQGAIDTLVASSATLLERAGRQFSEKVETESAKMTAVSAQITGSAVEVSSLGEAFGFAVQLFGESSEKLNAHLQRIEGSLSKSMARSDEQLAYYVAQAREIIDLSIVSQKQIVEDLQRLSIRQASLAGEAL